MSRYTNSNLWLDRAELTIPLGSQTFSKSRTQYPVGVSPLYISRAKKEKVWDVDGNAYIDLVSSLASVTLGYNDRSFNNNIKKQLRKGVTFSLPGTLEAEVAEMICELVPSAEMVRFGKNGTDATSAAVRLARAFTGRNKVLVCGYHGWQDWYIGSTSRDKGVPKEVSNLTKAFKFNDIAGLKNLLQEGDVACVVMEPMNVAFPANGFLENVRKLTSDFGSILIFDETITGFRFAKGGAQSLFGVTPDLSTFGKGIANGFPLSAVVGKKEIMREMEDIFFSGTFGGELLSLAAAKHVLLMHEDDKIAPVLAKNGSNLALGTEELISKHDLADYLSLSGHDSWKFMIWNGDEVSTTDELKTLFLQEVFARGLLILGTHNVTLKHDQRVAEKILSIYDEVFETISKGIKSGSISKLLKVAPLKPLFIVR